MAGLVKAGGLLDSKTIVHVRRGVEVKCSLKISPHREAKNITLNSETPKKAKPQSPLLLYKMFFFESIWGQIPSDQWLRGAPDEKVHEGC